MNDRRPIVVLSNAEVESLADWGAAIEALRAAYCAPIADAMVPPRAVATGRSVSMRALTAVSPDGSHVGAKLLTVAAHRAPDVAVSYLVTLIDQHSAEVVALMDGNHLTGLRTAATSALGIDAAAPPRALQVGVLGSGFEAWNHLVALTHVREVTSVRVFSPTAANREAFARRAASTLGVGCEAATSPQAAVEGVDLIVCAARAHDEIPILHGAWLTPGATVVSIGSTTPAQREVDAETLRRSDRLIVDVADEVLHHSGDGIAATQAGIRLDDRVVSLADVVAGRAVGRADDGEIVTYKSVGSALQDLAVAEMVFDRAVAAGVGTRIPSFVTPVRK